jgi:hypothetical protein
MPKDLDEFEKLIELRRKKFEKKLELSGKFINVKKNQMIKIYFYRNKI